MDVNLCCPFRANKGVIMNDPNALSFQDVAIGLVYNTLSG